MNDLNKLAEQLPNHIIIGKRLWCGGDYTDINHLNNDLNMPLDLISAFKKLINIIENNKDPVTEIMTDIEKLAWKQKYILRLVEQGLTLDMAKDDFEASDEIDYADDPVDSADEALSYYGE